MLFLEKLYYAISWLKNGWSIYRQTAFSFYNHLFFVLFFVLFVVIFSFLLFFVVLYMTAVLKIYDVLLPLRITSYPPKNPPRPAFPFELELP